MAAKYPDKVNSEAVLSSDEEGSPKKRQRLQVSTMPESSTNFPFVIKGVAEKDTETQFFASMADSGGLTIIPTTTHCENPKPLDFVLQQGCQIMTVDDQGGLANLVCPDDVISGQPPIFF